jgi:hypothetical protein
MTPYADPRPVGDIESCYFYHRMELPGVGVVAGQWDLRQTVEDYLAGFPFAGKRVLDVGAASGFPSFEMERRGADVVSFDMSPDGRWDIVPLAGADLGAAVHHKRKSWKALTNANWLAHAALRSSAKVRYGDIYRLPEALGDFNVAFLGSVLLHLQNPFEALLCGAPYPGCPDRDRAGISGIGCPDGVRAHTARRIGHLVASVAGMRRADDGRARLRHRLHHPQSAHAGR